ncbi:MAG: SMI1/KNR4 family protein [Xenococcaceae cyanobacterium MO_234.B1]|nr:SMI1/KNR4 family protein [Xenococcaceae cyanobacterium MO_234.B1]
MKFEYIEQEVNTLDEFIENTNLQVIPCSQLEIDELESLLPYKYKLPKAYKEFLLYGGKKIENLFRGVDFSYAMAKTLIENGYRDIYKMLKPWDPNVELPKDLFVINEHLGSNLTYFRLTEGDNPPVYFWEEGEGGLKVAEKETDTFSGFLKKRIENYIKIRNIL